MRCCHSAHGLLFRGSAGATRGVSSSSRPKPSASICSEKRRKVNEDHGGQNLRCWGRNAKGELGYGDTHSRGTSAGHMGNYLPVVDVGSDVDIETARQRLPSYSPKLGRTPKGSCSPRGCSRHLLETPFSEPLLRTLLRTLFFVFFF